MQVDGVIPYGVIIIKHRLPIHVEPIPLAESREIPMQSSV